MVYIAFIDKDRSIYLMVKEQERTSTKLDSDSNVIIDNWEYLDDFLAKYLDHLEQDKRGNENIFTELFTNLFTVDEQKKNIPTLNIIREKLWLYYYKERFKGNSNEPLLAKKKKNVETTKEETVSQQLCS